MTQDELRRLNDDILIKRHEFETHLHRYEIRDRLRDERPCVQDQLVTNDYERVYTLMNRASEAGNRYAFYEEYYYNSTGQLFERTFAQVIAAEYLLNRDFVEREIILLNDFYELLGLEHTDYGDQVGWEASSQWVNSGTAWIDFEHNVIKMDDGLEVMELRFLTDPGEYCIE